MAGVSEAVWSEEGTTPDRIEGALRELLAQRHAEDERFVPSRVLNMIAFVDREWSGEIANRLRGVGRFHASRMIALAYEPRRERLDARVMISAEGVPHDGEITLLRETVVVELGEQHLDDLITIADPLVVTDTPTLLWSPHGHDEQAQVLLALCQAILIDSADEPDPREAVRRACALSERVYVVDLAWLRSIPWRERVAAAFDPPWLRRELRTLSELDIRHHPASAVAAVLFAGWLASRLGWRPAPLVGRADALAGKADARGRDVALRLAPAPSLQVRGLEGLALKTAAGHRLSLDRGPGGLQAALCDSRGTRREWTVLGASRGETGVLAEGIRQALLRDRTYVPALRAAQAMLP
jgi:Glucose-6-phosphate dehydrogenase subunit C-terminal domain/Glucose-6-phosphate dehydrogenase subunit N-terminal domain